MNGPILTSRSFMPSIMILTILPILCFPLFLHLRARAEINFHFGACAGRADARRRDEGDVGHRRGAATKPIRALRRRAPPGCGPQACSKMGSYFRASPKLPTPHWGGIRCRIYENLY